jgi:hypothetical protein
VSAGVGDAPFMSESERAAPLRLTEDHERSGAIKTIKNGAATTP